MKKLKKPGRGLKKKQKKSPPTISKTAADSRTTEKNI
jgi:hypothetical protein